MVDEGRQRATEILTAKHAILDTLADTLEEKEVLSGGEVAEITRRQNGTTQQEHKV